MLPRVERIFRFIFSLTLLVLWGIPSHAHFPLNSNCELNQLFTHNSEIISKDPFTKDYAAVENSKYDLGKDRQESPSTHAGHKCGECTACFAMVSESSFFISLFFKSNLFFHSNSGYDFSFVSSPFNPPRV